MENKLLFTTNAGFSIYQTLNGIKLVKDKNDITVPAEYAEMGRITEKEVIAELKKHDKNPDDYIGVWYYRQRQLAFSKEHEAELRKAFEWAKTEGVAILKSQKEADDEKERRQIKVYLSSRGWGDYSGVEWEGDVNIPNEQILEESKKLLKSQHDVDLSNQTDAEILAKIVEAKTKWNKQNSESQTKGAELKAKFDEAAKTGQPVFIEKYMDDCNDSDEECNLDCVTVWAMPDGSKKHNRQHTW